LRRNRLLLAPDSGLEEKQVALAVAAPSRRLRSQSGMKRESAEILFRMRRTKTNMSGRL